MMMITKWNECKYIQAEVEEACRAKHAVEAELAETRDAFEKLEATAAKLRVTQEGAARELIDHQVCCQIGSCG